jgi:hypothetical protein
MNVCGVEIGEDVEVTATACLELRGFGTSQFNVTIYNREDHSVVYQIDLEGEAAAWSSVSSPSVRVPDYGSGQFAIMVSVPEGVPQGLYNLTAVIRSGGDVILTKQLYVSVAEPTEPGQQPVAVIQETPTGAVVLGEMDIMWVLVGLAVVINLALLVILIKKRQG